MSKANKSSKRLLSLDILRGITVAGMLLVNNPGTWSHIYTPLEHAEWIGLTPTDLVFPFFIFVMGVSMYFSLRKFNFKLNGTLLKKIVRRTVLLMLVGWAVSWFSHLMYGLARGDSFAVAVNNLDTIRILGVFQRLALCYFFGSLIAVLCNHKFIPWVIGILLVGYALLLQLGNGYDFSLDNILARVDNAVLGEKHMYHESAYGTKIALDPEGLLSTIPCIAHVLIGLMVGKLIMTYHDNHDRIMRLMILGTSMLLAGWLLQYGIPCGKKMWSSTFVLITTGMATCILALLIYVIDVKGNKRWCRFFEHFGVNPLALYLLGSILSIVFGSVAIGHSLEGDRITIHSMIYDGYLTFASEKCASLLYAITFVLINWVVGYILYKKKIYIKI